MLSLHYMRKILCLLALILLPQLVQAFSWDTSLAPGNWGINNSGGSTTNYGMSTLIVGGVSVLALAQNPYRAFLEIQPTCSVPIVIALGTSVHQLPVAGLQIGGGAIGTSVWNPSPPPSSAVWLQSMGVGGATNCTVQIIEGIR